MKQDCHNYVYKKCLRVSNTFISLRIFKSPFTCFRTLTENQMNVEKSREAY